MDGVTFCSLGGIGDVTKNLYIYETEKDLIVVDCGVGFPDPTMLGVDLVLPDISYLLAHKEKIRGIVITHAHEDHIGALPYLWPQLHVPIYATKLASAFIENKFRDFSLNTRVNTVNTGVKINLGVFGITFVHVNHSVPDSANLIIDSPEGIFYHGSDYKFDLTPLDGQLSDFGKIAAAGEKGVLCLLSDSLRSERPGYTLSERIVEAQLENEIENCPGKFIVTAHSSDIYRWQMVINVANKHQRKIVLAGRSVEQAVLIARKLGYLDLDERMIMEFKIAKNYPGRDICVLAAGSQGQPESALARIANNDNKYLKIKSGDVVVFSADPIPGNENAVHTMIDTLTKLGARVSYSEVEDDLHVSGHAAQQEMMMLMALTKPKYLIPIGGTYRQMKKYSLLAQSMGHPVENVFLLETGQQVIFSNKRVVLGKKIELRNVLIDGLGIGDVGNVVLKDRRQMSKDGVVIAIVSIEASTGQIMGTPEILSRGFVYMKESEELIKNAQKEVEKSVSRQNGRIMDWQFIRKRIENNLAKFLYEQTARRPMILSVIVEV